MMNNYLIQLNYLIHDLELDYNIKTEIISAQDYKFNLSPTYHLHVIICKDKDCDSFYLYDVFKMESLHSSKRFFTITQLYYYILEEYFSSLERN